MDNPKSMFEFSHFINSSNLSSNQIASVMNMLSSLVNLPTRKSKNNKCCNTHEDLLPCTMQKCTNKSRTYSSEILMKMDTRYAVDEASPSIMDIMIITELCNDEMELIVQKKSNLAWFKAYVIRKNVLIRIKL